MQYMIECGGAIASSVKVDNPNVYLTLCEVQVFGLPVAAEGEFLLFHQLYNF